MGSYSKMGRIGTYLLLSLLLGALISITGEEAPVEMVEENELKKTDDKEKKDDNAESCVW